MISRSINEDFFHQVGGGWKESLLFFSGKPTRLIRKEGVDLVKGPDIMQDSVIKYISCSL